MRRRNFDVINYIDDITGIDFPSRIDAYFDTLYSLLHHLGFEVSQKKLVHPSTVINCLDILVNTKYQYQMKNYKKFFNYVSHGLIEETALRHNCNLYQLQSLAYYMFQNVFTHLGST